MADKQDRWLDRETAERLLRGESPDNAVDALDAVAREEAERLARTLGALAAHAAEPLPADEELPGEAAALAAFRKAHADRADLAGRAAPAGLATGSAGLDGGTTAAGTGRLRGTHAADAGLVRIGGRVPEAAGRPARWSRPVRLGLAAALAAGMVGGIAAGTGVLPTPFDGAEPARPAASVPAPVVPDEGALVPPTPDAPGSDEDPATPDGGTGATGREDAGNGKADGAPSATPDPRGTWPTGAASACRDLSAGRTLDTGRRQSLEHLAGGPARVSKYCAAVLDGTAAGNPRGDDRSPNGTTGRDTGKNQGDREGRGGATGDRSGSGDKSGSDDDGDGDGGRDRDRDRDDDRDRGRGRGVRGEGQGGEGHGGGGRHSDGSGERRDGGGSGRSGGSSSSHHR
ncbi:hypothetical protein [Streptomyces sp. Root1310]|uniref:hypothetical protein n=1 Tax=Streptomyces sp. Root1310 TaxID=1736452 RepID=UPI000709B7CF|nr:hypothetical protein [Streptomyces sp. Root1310]KQX71089.1 hypothetical protein ASD48_11815 [Streptomyces sp. Root1310]